MPFAMLGGPSSPVRFRARSTGTLRLKRNEAENVEQFDALLNECLDNAFLDNGLDITLDDFLDYMSICEKKVLATVAGQVKTNLIKTITHNV
jgi:nicotinate-nucleotide pyrophosphorylase